jgi:hypothetical protein
MPIDLTLYPEDWEEISHRIRFERGGGQYDFLLRKDIYGDYTFLKVFRMLHRYLKVSATHDLEMLR